MKKGFKDYMGVETQKKPVVSSAKKKVVKSDFNNDALHQTDKYVTFDFTGAPGSWMDGQVFVEQDSDVVVTWPDGTQYTLGVQIDNPSALVPVTNSRKAVKSSGDYSTRAAVYRMGYDKLKQAKVLLKSAWSVLSGSEFEDDVGDAISKVSDIIYALEENGNVLAQSRKPVKSALDKEGKNNFYDFRRDLFNAISGVYQEYNMHANGPTADKSDFDAVVKWMNDHGYWDGEYMDGDMDDEPTPDEYNDYLDSLQNSKQRREIKSSPSFDDNDFDNLSEEEILKQYREQKQKRDTDRQAKADAEAKAKKEADEKAARLARGEYTDEEKAQNIRHNCMLLEKYIASMEDDLKSQVSEACNRRIKFGNPAGLEPRDYTRGNDYLFRLFPMYVNYTAPRNIDDNEIYDYLGSSYDYYKGTLTWYPDFDLDSLTNTMVDEQSEADMYHSGVRNKEGWKECFVDGTKILEDEEEIHMLFDGDAELFACVKWQLWESLGVMVAVSCLAESDNNVEDAIADFYNTPYGQEVPGGNEDNWLFKEYAGVFLPEDE